MNTMKKAKPKRLLSLLLTVVMLLGVLPLSAVPASAAGGFVENPSWTTISGANDSTRMATLKGYLSQSGTKYIKLGDDIELDHDLDNFFPINGEKHLDLNGHRINYSDGRAVSKEATATEKGSKHEECKNCGDKMTAVEIPATGTPTTPTNPTKPADTKSPQTGDNSNMIRWIALLFFRYFSEDDKSFTVFRKVLKVISLLEEESVQISYICGKKSA